MKRLKTFLLVLLALPSSLSLIAQDAIVAQKLVISKSDKTEFSFLLSEKPKIMFQDDNYGRMDITTTSSKLTLDIYELDKMTIVSVEDTKISDIIGRTDATLTWHGDALLIDVQSGNSKVMIFGADGKVFLSQELLAGRHIIPLTDFPKGVNLIKVNNETIKIWNR